MSVPMFTRMAEKSRRSRHLQNAVANRGGLGNVQEAQTTLDWRSLVCPEWPSMGNWFPKSSWTSNGEEDMKEFTAHGSWAPVNTLHQAAPGAMSSDWWGSSLISRLWDSMIFSQWWSKTVRGVGEKRKEKDLCPNPSSLLLTSQLC